MEECVDEYAALADLMERMHALPFELNRAAALGLCAPTTRCTLLRRVEEGARIMPRCRACPVTSVHAWGARADLPCRAT